MKTEEEIKAEKDVIDNIPEDEETAEKIEVKEDVDVSSWKPRTSLGRMVKSKVVTDIDDILDKGLKIQEPEIVDALIPDLETDLLLIGQAKGKFGGGQRRIFKQTQKKTQEGNKPQFATMAIVGNRNGYVGLGYGKAKETVPAREKAIKAAKLNVFKIRRGSGSWESSTNDPHSIPFAVEGKVGSVRLRLLPAPKGKGIVAEKECRKIIALAGIKDVWTKTEGHTGTKSNLVLACLRALKKLSEFKLSDDKVEDMGIVDGKIKEER